MPEKNSTLSYRWFQEVWNNGRENAIDEMMHENVVVHGVDDIKETGRAAFKHFFHEFRQLFPSIHFDAQEVITEGDLQASRCVVTATTANGQQVQFTGMTFIRMSNGKIIEGWNNFDFLGMQQQMGFQLTAAGS